MKNRIIKIDNREYEVLYRVEVNGAVYSVLRASWLGMVSSLWDSRTRRLTLPSVEDIDDVNIEGVYSGFEELYCHAYGINNDDVSMGRVTLGEKHCGAITELVQGYNDFLSLIFDGFYKYMEIVGEEEDSK